MSLSLDLIGEFKGKNTVYRVLPDGEIETSGQGTGKIMGVDAMMLFTTVGIMTDGLFIGEGTGVITTMAGETVTLKMNSSRLAYWKRRNQPRCIYTSDFFGSAHAAKQGSIVARVSYGYDGQLDRQNMGMEIAYLLSPDFP